MKRMLILLSVVVTTLGIVPAFGTGCTSNGGRTTFIAELNGANEIPPVTTTTTGRVEITFNKERTMATYKITINGGVGVISSELHFGKANVTGPIQAILFDQPAGIDVNGILVERSLSESSFLGELASLPALENAIKQGSIYCNVHTLANPGGALRGQLR
jgi:hypothetical protein